MASPGSQARGFHDAGRLGRDKTKGTASGDRPAGSAAPSNQVIGAGTAALTQPRDPAGPKGAISGGSGEGPGAKAYSTKADRGGGTTTQDQYSPGALQNRPLADALTVLEKVAIPAVPGAGTIFGAATVADTAMTALKTGKLPSGDETGLLGGDPGPQRGWQPDKFKGKANLTGIGDPGSASGTDQREIAGASLRASATPGLQVGDLAPGPQVGDDWADVALRDRRKPRDLVQSIMMGVS